jgi:hypothetical protein
MACEGNKYALGNNGGRPAHYETPEELREKCIAFFERCEEKKEKATVTGLCLFLGFASRSSLDDYDKRGDEFSYIIKRAKLAVENSYEMSGGTFDIFALKNMGWKDKTEMDVRTPEGITVNYNRQPGNEPLADGNS